VVGELGYEAARHADRRERAGARPMATHHDYRLAVVRGNQRGTYVTPLHMRSPARSQSQNCAVLGRATGLSSLEGPGCAFR
jgi:hypothetical protein